MAEEPKAFALDERLRALAHPVRRQLVADCLGAPRTAGDLVARCGLAPASVSEHLKVLRKTGLVTMTVQGTWRLYATDRTRVEEASALLADFTESLTEED